MSWAGIIALAFAASAEGGLEALPDGIASFFIAPECPAGWRTVENADGRLIVGTNNAANVGKFSGTPLASGEARSHRHPYEAKIDVKQKEIAAATEFWPFKRNFQGAKKGMHSVSGHTVPSNGNIPYIQYHLCEPAAGTEHVGSAQHTRVTLPYNAVSFFTTRQCPAHWTPYDSANGRFIVPMTTDVDVGEIAGTPLDGIADPPHLHAFSLPVPVPAVDYAVAPGCCNKNLGESAGDTLSGEASDTASDMPVLSLLVCRLQSHQGGMDVQAPDGFSIFVAARYCENGLSDTPCSKGRYLVALPEGGDWGLAFGGEPVPAGELPRHRHAVSGELDASRFGIVGLSGGQAKNYAKRGKYSFNGITDDGTVNLPYIALRQCSK